MRKLFCAPTAMMRVPPIKNPLIAAVIIVLSLHVLNNLDINEVSGLN
ncbi:hypothetical protein GCHA_1235 [Paraglaciecola chathamensis S18K6]|uniref:Uncharacterized protein n=2 Tax=Paraglaciecola chathamensis TaxID=368405 RepID=A0ABQ0IEJ1_9ALTE|nr:hypothetical protein GAGA_4807 [Paraglaciecola agarilytica NO2]GAC09196.1 hypothetical protein GCHA_1235 [Paraglaciecola chathamensis S18K6]